MKLRILTACAVAALAVGTGANAQELPDWNPQTICIEDSTPQHCGFLEGQARSHISEQWQFIPSLVRERCLTRSEKEETVSWRLFGDCIADAARAPGSDGGASSAVASSTASTGGGNTADMDALRAELDTTKSSVAGLEAELKKAQAEKQSSEAQIKSLQQKLAASAAAATAAAVAVASTSATAGDDGDTAELQAALDKAESRARGAEFRTNALQSTLKEIIASSKATKTEDEAALEKADTELKRSSARIEGLQQRLMEANDASAAEGGGGDTEALQAALDKAESRARGAEFRTNALQSTLKEVIASSKATKTEDEAALEKATTELKRSSARIEGLQQRLVEAVKLAEGATTGGDSDERIASLEAELEKANTGVRSGEARIEGLQQRLIAANERADASPAPAGGGDEAAGLRQQLDVAESRIGNLQARLRNGRDSLLEAREGRTASERNLEGARTRILALQDAIITSRKVSQDEMAALKAELAKLQAMSSDAASDGTDIMAANKSLEALLANQRERSARVAETVSTQRVKIRDLESELSTLRRAAQTSGISSCQQRLSNVVSSGGIQFENNKADLRADASQTINRLISIIRDCENTRITVKGHTDALGDRAYNLGLSQRRADAVVTYMESNGVAPGLVTAIGVGPDEPVADNNTRAGRAQNRRIELLVE